MKFTKMHGLGNNYIYVNEFEVPLKEEELSSIAKQVANVRFGIGSDGMILIGPSEVAEFKMRIFNVDGSEGKNCGNGLRCVAKYVYDRQLTNKKTFTIETLGGIVDITIHVNDKNLADLITVDMGKPRLLKEEIPMVGDPKSQTISEPVTIEDKTYAMTCVSMGNPHAIIFVDDVSQAPVETLGPKVETATIFPERTNVEFIRILNKKEIDFRVWERGSGITFACGTGACASVVAGVLNGHLERGQEVIVHLLGGDLKITWAKNDHVYMTGPAEFVCDGEFYI